MKEDEDEKQIEIKTVSYKFRKEIMTLRYVHKKSEQINFRWSFRQTTAMIYMYEQRSIRELTDSERLSERESEWMCE